MVREFFDIQEKPVRDTLESLAIAGAQEGESRLVLVGGMALQMYATTERDLLRPTSDIDVLDPANRSYEVFRGGIANSMIAELRKRGYAAQSKRGKAKNEVKVMKGQNARAQELFFAHFTRYSPETFKRIAQVTEREVAYAKELVLPYEGSQCTIKVVSPEDMIPYKLRRLKNYMEKERIEDPIYGVLLAQVEDFNWEELAKIDLRDWCERLTTMQSRIAGHNGETTPEKGRYVVNKDLYDFCLLARVFESRPELFNRAYLLQARDEVESAFSK